MFRLRKVAALAAVLLCCGCSLFPIDWDKLKEGGGTDVTVPEPTPARLFGLDATLPPTMAGRRADALKVAAVFEELARQIEYDGQRQPRPDGTTGEPICVHTDDVGLRMQTAFEYAAGGPNRLMSDAGKAAVNSVLAAELGNQELTAELRATAVAINRAAAHALRQVK